MLEPPEIELTGFETTELEETTVALLLFTFPLGVPVQPCINSNKTVNIAIALFLFNFK